MERPVLLKKGSWDSGTNPIQDCYFVLRFTIGKDGRTSDVEVASRGFAPKVAVESAMRLVKSYVFKPAKRDGEPYEAKVRMPFSISHGDGTGISSEFVREARKVETLIKAGDYPGADFHAQWMLSDVVRTRSEYAALQGTLAMTYAGSGQLPAAILALRAATERTTPVPELVLRQTVTRNSEKNYLVSDAKYISELLELKMRLTMQQGMLLESLTAYYDLAGFKGFPPDDPHVRVAHDLTVLLESSAPLVAKVETDESGNWSHQLFRRHFTLEQVQGVVKKVDLNCDSRFRTLEYAEGATWAIPDSWKDCSISIDAERGTRLHIVEFDQSQSG